MTYQKILRKKIQIMPTNKSMKEETLEAMHRLKGLFFHGFIGRHYLYLFSQDFLVCHRPSSDPLIVHLLPCHREP